LLGVAQVQIDGAELVVELSTLEKDETVHGSFGLPLAVSAALPRA
jgi:hypothetical protein